MKKQNQSQFKMAIIVLSALACLSSSVHAESLWLRGGTERSMFSSKIAYRVGDILTIKVNETIDFTSEQSIDTGQKSSALVDLAGVLADTVQWDALEGKSVALSDLIKGKYSTTPSSVTGKTNIVSAQIPVGVIDVLPNHNLVVEGMRNITFSGETRFIVFRGIVRPLDIDVTTNSIASNQVANAQLEFVSKGSVGDIQQKGWFTRFIDKINPF